MGRYWSKVQSFSFVGLISLESQCTDTMTTLSNTALNSGNMLRVDFRYTHCTQKMLTMQGDDMLISLNIIITSLCISNHVIHLKYI